MNKNHIMKIIINENKSYESLIWKIGSDILDRCSSIFQRMTVRGFLDGPLVPTNRISGQMMLAMVMMICGALMYVSDMPSENWNGAAWVFLSLGIFWELAEP